MAVLKPMAPRLEGFAVERFGVNGEAEKMRVKRSYALMVDVFG
jgi:hypothetical protein